MPQMLLVGLVRVDSEKLSKPTDDVSTIDGKYAAIATPIWAL